MTLKGKILRDPLTKWIFSQGLSEVYLVGGYVRDVLLGRHSGDRDFVLRGQVESLARRTAQHRGGRMVVLKKNHVCRVILREGQNIDFSRLSGTITHDLASRDFTINAMAWSPERGLIDPHEGSVDLRKHIIRMVRPGNIAADPLRILRAFRFAAQLNFTIEGKTQTCLARRAKQIRSVAGERTAEELIALCNTHNAFNLVQLSHFLKVLSSFLNMSRYQLDENIDMIRDFECWVDRLLTSPQTVPGHRKLRKLLSTSVSQGLSSEGLIKIALLMKGKSPEITEDTLKMLRLSRINSEMIQGIHRALSASRGRMTDSLLYRVFQSAGPAVREAALVLWISRRRGGSRIYNRAEDYIRIRDRKIISGDEIRETVRAEPGPIIGSIEGDIQRMRFMGQLRSKRQIHGWLRSYFT